MPQPAVIMIDFGDPPSLAALALQRDPARVLLWSPAPDEADECGKCVQLHQDTFETAGLVLGAPVAPGIVGDGRMLLETCEVAIADGCDTVVWPVMRGPDLEGARPILDLVSHIAAVSGLEGETQIVIDTPLLDLTESQVIELIITQGVPITLSLPFMCGSAPPGDEASRRWTAALAGLGHTLHATQPVATPS